MVAKEERLSNLFSPVLETVDLPEYLFGPKTQGKVRDIWALPDDKLVMVTTDRQSAFDRIVCLTPGKGRQLNMLSAWWFERTRDTVPVPNHLLALPHPNAMVCQKCEPVPVEMVIRGYITGSTSTSLWRNYSEGTGRYDWLGLPSDLVKNQKLPQVVITPTTKAPGGQHDVPLTRDQAIESFGDLYRQLERVSLALFERGSQIYQKAGLILVDTKFEFGLSPNGQLTLIDELFTPDSSRIWLAETYEERISRGQEPDSLDKEFLRLWLRSQGFSGEGPVPNVPEEITSRLAALYAEPYQRLTGTDLSGVDSSQEAISAAILNYFSGNVIKAET